MFNFSIKILMDWVRPALVASTVALALFQPILADAAEARAPARYKKQTVVDFEDALIEGKSRKPYSAYLSKQKSEEQADLFSWSLDLEKKVQSSAQSLVRLK